MLVNVACERSELSEVKMIGRASSLVGTILIVLAPVLILALSCNAAPMAGSKPLHYLQCD